ncbi:hypothetical protein CPC08DRAFT_739086 [Agrocybe pediades]|nr:hypothetical protein CPC08DRAFT_739086 [Agrocybe pediades]
MSSTTRKPAPRLARPAVRYWKGKAPKGAAEVDSDSEEEEVPTHLEEGDVALDDHELDEEDFTELGQIRGKQQQKAMNIALKDVSVSKEGKVIVAGREESGRTIEEEDEEEGDEYESESEEEKVEFRPVFVPKRARVTIAEKESIAQDTEEALRKKELEAEERRKQSHDLVAESIRRELAEKEKEEDIPDVDDTDGLDPAAEFEAWRLRELGRIKKEKEDELQREKEREEIERRRALPEEQRLKEDLERAQKLREEKPKGQQKFLQKYWHKGAFHQDEEILKRHDYTEATESTVDVSLLPKVMQVKNFGKRSRTKYTHLLDQDTTAAAGGFGGTASIKAGGKGTEGGGCFLCGGPHLKKDCPQNNETGRPTGANAAHSSNKRYESSREDRQESWKDRDNGYRRDDRRDDYHERRRQDSRRQKRSRGYFCSLNCPYITVKYSVRSSNRNLYDATMTERKNVKVAIIGSGLAGLTAAYLLKRPCEGDLVDFEVHLFEKASAVGMDSSSISLPTPGQKEDWRIDVPMRSFQGGYYKNLIALYQSLGIKFRQADFSYSFSALKFPTSRWRERSITTTMIYNGGSGRSGVSKPSYLSANAMDKQGRLVNFVYTLWTSALFILLTIQLVFCYLITLYHSLPFWRPENLSSLTFRTWALQQTPTSFLAKLTRMDVAWDHYIQTVMIPLLSAVCTAPEEDVLNHPMEEVLDYVWLTFGTHHYVVTGGVRNVVARLTDGVHHLHLGSPITSMRPDAEDPRCITISCSVNGETVDFTGFRHVILATQASGASFILSKYLETIPEKLSHRKEGVQDLVKCLQSFEYRTSIVINHTDDTLLPDNGKDIRDLNLISADPQTDSSMAKSKEFAGVSVPFSYTMATHILTQPDGVSVSRPSFFQTTNPIIPPKQETLLSVASLERAIVTEKSRSALEGLCISGSKKWWHCPYEAKTYLGDLQGLSSDVETTSPGIWICGSYAHLGIPLLEGCVVSARNVVEQGILDREGVKWKTEPWVV